MRREESRHDAGYHRAYWHSRRGMLELEFQLLPFVRDCYRGLTEEDQAVYVRVLEHEDWQIFDWLQGRDLPLDPALLGMIDRIVAYGREPHGPL